jgi:hypothetical protein
VTADATSSVDFVKPRKKEKRGRNLPQNPRKMPTVEKPQKPRPIGPICCHWLLGDGSRGQMEICGRQFTDMQTIVEHLDTEHMGSTGNSLCQSAVADPNGEVSQIGVFANFLIF